MHISGIILLPLVFVCEILNGSVPGPFLFVIFISHLYSDIKHCRWLLLAGGTKIFCIINPVDDCTLMLSDIDCMQGWCTADFMKQYVGKTRFVTFTWKTNFLKYIGVFLYYSGWHYQCVWSRNGFKITFSFQETWSLFQSWQDQEGVYSYRTAYLDRQALHAGTDKYLQIIIPWEMLSCMGCVTCHPPPVSCCTVNLTYIVRNKACGIPVATTKVLMPIAWERVCF